MFEHKSLNFIKLKFSQKILWIFIIIAVIVVLIANIIVLKVPIFADGTQHVWITRYVTETGSLPVTDITGVQASNFSIPRSISEPEPFLYQPLFYILAGILGVITGNVSISISVINILSIFLTGIFLYLLSREMFNKEVGMIVFVLCIFSNIWPWMTVHRLVEPIIITFVIANLYFTYKYLNNQKIYLVLIVMVTVFLFAMKQSTYPLILSIVIGILLKRHFKDILYSLITMFLLVAPFIYYNLVTFHAVTPSPVGINKIDELFNNAWWNQKGMEWEEDLNKLIHKDTLRQKTYEQFKEVQKSPQNLFFSNGMIGIFNQFSIYPIAKRSTEGYQSLIPEKMSPIFILMYAMAIIAFYKNRKFFIKNKLFCIFILFLYLLTILLWIKQPVFRYYIYISFLSLLVLSYGIYFILKLKNTLILSILLLMISSLVLYNLKQEVDRDLNYNYTAMHRSLPSKNGGLEDSKKFAEYMKINDNKSKYVITPMVENSFL